MLFRRDQKAMRSREKSWEEHGMKANVSAE
jgi:hypothetical protein